MKLQRISISLLAALCLATTLPSSKALPQSSKLYQQMAESERAAFVAEQAQLVARQMSGNDYRFTKSFEEEIRKAVDFYVRRIGNNAGDRPGRGDARFIFERGQTVAPTLIRVFKAGNVSPLIGLYIPLVESEYVNIQTPNSHGSLGMFQFVPQTAQHYGLQPNELLDVEKSADAAARYIAENLKRFEADRMKETLALLAYNRGANQVERDLGTVGIRSSNACSVCSLTEQRSKLDATFQSESVYYVPRFFAGAIIGENPQVFGMQTRPLSSLEAKR